MGLLITIGCVPQSEIKEFLKEMGSSIRASFTWFSVSIISYMFVLGACFASISGSLENLDPVTVSLIGVLACGMLIAWYHHHTQQDRVLINISKRYHSLHCELSN